MRLFGDLKYTLPKHSFEEDSYMLPLPVFHSVLEGLVLELVILLTSNIVNGRAVLFENLGCVPKVEMYA